MRRFAALFEALDASPATGAKVDALAAYFAEAPPEDAAWAVYFLSGLRLQRLVSGRTLRHWAGEAAGLAPWLVEESHAAVGDSAETVALLLALDGAKADDLPLASWVEDRLLPLRALSPAGRQARITLWWQGLDRSTCFLLGKLLTGAFRVGVSRLLVARALARLAGTPPAVMSHRLMGGFRPSAQAFRALIEGERVYRARVLDRSYDNGAVALRVRIGDRQLERLRAAGAKMDAKPAEARPLA